MNEPREIRAGLHARRSIARKTGISVNLDPPSCLGGDRRSFGWRLRCSGRESRPGESPRNYPISGRCGDYLDRSNEPTTSGLPVIRPERSARDRR
jgi:hypothetical protein